MNNKGIDMRDIKFRAWNKKDKFMQAVCFLSWLVGGIKADDAGTYIGNGWVEGTGTKKDSECDVILMQYTGQLDENITEIYEGDIVKQRKNCMFDDGYVVQQVVFNKDQFVSGNCSLYQAVNTFRAKVIGNIYENPELLVTPDHQI